MQRNFALDCFRALAIMLVFTGHTINSLGSPQVLAPLQFGGTGVDLFFVLSGWLIGNQLLIEKKKYGNVEIRRFWYRRWMRTLPAYYAVLSLTILQQFLTKDTFDFPWAYLFFLQNYQVNLDIFYVSWSLSVEEQFYLLIAPLMVLLFRTPKSIQILILLSLFLSPLIFRLLGWYQSSIETHVRLDCCAMGVLLAYVKHHLTYLWCKLTHCIRVVFPIAVLTYLMFYVARYNPDWGFNDPDKLVLALIFGTWIVWADQTKYSEDVKLKSLVMHVSTRSYAMYLLHVDALAITKRFISKDFIIFYYLTALVITLVLSEILYRAVEVPIMEARKRFKFSMSRGQLESLRAAIKGSRQA